MDNDYFTAELDPKTKIWLSLVEGRHASELTWNLYRTGRYNEALGDCIYTLERFPNHPGALHLLTQIAEAIHQPSKPIAHFENAIRLFPQHAYTHAQYGHYLVGIGATAAGIAELETAVRLDPDLLQARAWLAAAQSARNGGPIPARADSVSAR